MYKCTRFYRPAQPLLIKQLNISHTFIISESIEGLTVATAVNSSAHLRSLPISVTFRVVGVLVWIFFQKFAGFIFASD